MLIYLQMEPKWSQNRIKSIKSILTHPDHETSIFQHSGPTVQLTLKPYKISHRHQNEGKFNYKQQQQ